MTERHRDPSELLKVAVELQEKKDRARESEKDRELARAAAAEMGVDPTYVDEAEQELRAREQAEAEARQAELARRAAARRKLTRLGLIGVVVASFALGGGYVLLRPGPPPIEEAFTAGAARWSLETSAGTQASVSWVSETGRGEVAQVSIQSIVPGADGKYWINLDGRSLDLSGRDSVHFQARSEGVPTLRLYLENGNERWRSPALSLGSAWQEQRLSLRDFERQERVDGQWKVVGWKAPETATPSFKLGHFVNEPDVAGEVWIDDLVIE